MRPPLLVLIHHLYIAIEICPPLPLLIGKSQHEGHLPRNAIDMATRKRIVPAAATDFQKMSANHNIGPGKTAAMVEEEFGLHLTCRQVAQMQQMAKLADDLNNTDELERFKHLDSDTDRVLAYLKKKCATYCALYHGADSGQLIWTERMDYVGNQGHVQCEVLADEEVFAGDLYEYASHKRKAVSARDDQHVLISLLWAMPIGKRCLQAFPELRFSDAFQKTNQENRPLITFGVKDAKGRVQVVIRAWAPNERTWMFCWLF
ncbi:hypothetical protein IV203_014554 [Nitzschia inconspicua]|uniref:ZSWIM1/3 RNaseH-like domain-containing protein n=1 Tax=Nitzschia inconspicua TaxID=303405 RepID=A0A9K3L960_9STRA|nr:hypothetical protein IV203_014554 [Nitzschia inconspicua]